MKFIKDIYFFEVNTKYISSIVLKISEISRVRSTSDSADIFNTFDEIFFNIYFKKVNFPFIFSVKGKTSARLVGIILSVNAVRTKKMGYNAILMNE